MYYTLPRTNSTDIIQTIKATAKEDLNMIVIKG